MISASTRAASFYAPLKERARRIEDAYRRLTPASAALAETARAVLPGGCARQGVFRSPYPVYVAEAQGAVLTDVDGRRLIDFCFNATSLPLGHAHPAVVAAVSQQLARGTAYLSPTALEIELAFDIQRRLPSAERMIFANTGGEAVMMALRLARAFTGRPVIAKFEGSFHGNYDDVLWSVAPRPVNFGPEDAPTPVPLSEGLLRPDGRTLVLPFNAAADAVRLIEAHAHDLAAVLLEPLAYRMGVVPAEPDFVRAIGDACARHGILLIIDEVLCFRAAYHGMQGILRVHPDLTVLGKIIGGGFPVGAVAGRADVLALADPHDSRVYHTGTFAANPVTLTAGKATLDQLTPDAFDDLGRVGDRLRERLSAICEGLPLQISGVASLFKISATAEPVRNYRGTVACDREWERLASLALLNRGIFVTSHLGGCIATTTTAAQVDRFVDAFRDVVAAPDSL